MKLYLVGGFIRNLLLNRFSKDMDFVIYQVAGDRKVLADIEALACEIGGALFCLSEEHGTMRLNLPDQYLLESIDFSLIEEDITADLAKRDFTVNALAINLTQWVQEEGFTTFLKRLISNPTAILHSYKDCSAIIDPFNGIEALAKKELIPVSDEAFKRDPLRMLRGIRLGSELDLKMTPETEKNLKSQALLIDSVAGERIKEEFFRILKNKNSYVYIELMDELGLLRVIWPQLEELVQVKQNTHHTVDAWTHCKLALKALEEILENHNKWFSEENQEDIEKYLDTKLDKSDVTKKQLLKLAVLFHDLGKLTTGQTRNGKITFYGHDKVGAELFSGIGVRLRLSTKELTLIKKLIHFHMRPLLLSLQDSVTDKALYRLLIGLKEDIIGALVLSMADFKSKQDPKGLDEQNLKYGRFLQGIMVRIRVLQQREQEIKPVNGNEVLKINPQISSKKIGDILRTLREQQILGEVKDEKDTLALLGKLVRKD